MDGAAPPLLGRTMTAEPLIAAAQALWEPLAAYAWTAFGVHGRGAVLADAEAFRAAASSGADLPADLFGFVPVAIVPKADDFRPLLLRYDPEVEVMLLIRHADGSDQMLGLAAGGPRPRPPACAAERAT